MQHSLLSLTREHADGREPIRLHPSIYHWIDVHSDEPRTHLHVF